MVAVGGAELWGHCSPHECKCKVIKQWSSLQAAIFAMCLSKMRIVVNIVETVVGSEVGYLKCTIM